MKQSELIVTVTKSVTLTTTSETIELSQTVENVDKDGKRTLVKHESSKTVKPVNLLSDFLKEVA